MKYFVLVLCIFKIANKYFIFKPFPPNPRACLVIESGCEFLFNTDEIIYL